MAFKKDRLILSASAACASATYIAWTEGSPTASGETCICSANVPPTAFTYGAASSSGTDGSGASAYVGTGALQADSSGATASCTVQGFAFSGSGVDGAASASATRMTTWNALTSAVALVTGGTITSLGTYALKEVLIQDNDLNPDA